MKTHHLGLPLRETSFVHLTPFSLPAATSWVIIAPLELVHLPLLINGELSRRCSLGNLALVTLQVCRCAGQVFSLGACGVTHQ